MEIIHYLVDFILHLDKHLAQIIQDFSGWTYLILFLIVFCETGLVVTPFLPGDSLLFAAGAFAAVGVLNVVWVYVIFAVAAILGDSVNYAIGQYLGPKVFSKESGRFLKREYLERTHQFYEKYGAKTIVLARFVPIVRTFAPFVAGVGRMSYLTFISYNVLGGLLWVSVCVLGGYFFGNIPIIKKNFSLAVLAIIFVSLIPVVLEVWNHRRPRISTRA